MALGTPLAGCVSNNGFATFGAPGDQVAEGEGVCSAFERPKYRVVGATAYDQLWADRITEAGIAGCAWARPEKRPASLDEKPAPTPKPAPEKKKPAYLKMLRGLTS